MGSAAGWPLCYRLVKREEAKGSAGPVVLVEKVRVFAGREGDERLPRSGMGTGWALACSALRSALLRVVQMMLRRQEFAGGVLMSDRGCYRQLRSFLCDHNRVAVV